MNDYQSSRTPEDQPVAELEHDQRIRGVSGTIELEGASPRWTKIRRRGRELPGESISRSIRRGPLGIQAAEENGNYSCTYRCSQAMAAKVLRENTTCVTN